MNGRKVLDRLIILFVVINLILGMVNIISASTRYVINEDRIHNIYEVLAKENVSVEAELPISFKPRPSINILYEVSTPSIRDDIVKTMFNGDITKVLRSTKQSEINKGFKQYQFSTGDEKLSFEKYNVEYSNEAIDKDKKGITIDLANKYVNKFIKRIGRDELYNGSYMEYEELDNYISVKCYPMIDKVALDDVYMTLEVYKDGISEAIFPLIRVELIENSHRDIIPIDRVLFGVDEYINSMVDMYLDEICIKEVRMVYKKQNPESYNLWGEKNTPVYKLNVKGLEKAVFVNAYTNEYIK